MDEGQSRRSLSPYHEKCFPPYCDSVRQSPSRKGLRGLSRKRSGSARGRITPPAHQVDKSMVSKMPRGDLEDKYITFADENLELKRQAKNQEQQIQRLQTALKRQDKVDRRSGTVPTSMVVDSNKLAILEAQNKNLNAKIKVLKQQLMNHSYIHAHENRQSKPSNTPRPSDLQVPSSARQDKGSKNRIAELENQLEDQKNKYKARIAQLEKELEAMEKEVAKSGTSVHEQLSETSRQVKDNTELIKLRMQAENQEKDLDNLREKLTDADKKIEKLEQDLKKEKDRANQLEKDLEREKRQSRSAMSQVRQSIAQGDTIKSLEEKVRDLQKERDTLKDTNEKLLELNQVPKEPSGHSLQISKLEKDLKNKLDELNDKDKKIKDLEDKLVEAEKDAEDANRMLQAAPERTEGATRLRTESGTIETEALRLHRKLLNFTVQRYWQNVNVSEALLAIHKPLRQKEDCENCVDLSKKLCSALMDNAKLKSILESQSAELDSMRDELQALRDMIENFKGEIANLEGEKKDLEKKIDDLENKLADANKDLDDLRQIVAVNDDVKDENDNLKEQNKKYEDELNKANDELAELRPIAEEHKNCRKTPLPSVSSKEENLKKKIKDLEDALKGAEDELAALRPIAEEHALCRKSPKPSISSKDDEALRKQNQRLEDALNKAYDELAVLRPIAEEHQACKKNSSPFTSSKSIQIPTPYVSVLAEPSHISEPEPSPITSEDSVHSKKTIDSERYIALTQQLEQALRENEKLRQELEGRDGDDALKLQNQRLEDELNRALRELREVRPLAEEHRQFCTKSKEDVAPVESPRNSTLSPRSRERSSSLEKSPQQSYHTKDKSPQPSYHTKEKSPQPSYHTKDKSPVPSYHSGNRGQERRNKKWPDVKKVLFKTINEEIPSEWKTLDAIMEAGSGNEKAVPAQEDKIKEETPGLKIVDNYTLMEENLDSLSNNNAIRVTESVKKTDSFIDDGFDEEVGKSAQESAKSLKTGKQKRTEVREEKGGKGGGEKGNKTELSLAVEDSKEERLKSQVNSEEVDENNTNSTVCSSGDGGNDLTRPPLMPNVVSVRRLLRHRTPLTISHADLGGEPVPLTPRYNALNLLDPEPFQVPRSPSLSVEEESEVLSVTFYGSSVLSNRENGKILPPVSVRPSDRIKRGLIKHQNREDILHDFFDQEPSRPDYRDEPKPRPDHHEERKPRSDYEPISRPDYVSHVTPPPSLHCAETVDINDPEQKANLLIVSKHDFETVLMQKKKYTTEVEVVEPVDGRQTLNCKLEICMYDLDIDEKMLDYLQSIQPEPKVYVEWSFVGLDQRTAPLPAEQALFYTNVMYYGPLSREIKSYLNKVEMPVDLYLVKGSGAPLKVAEGTLDMLPAMEQPNRGFMRSVFMRGKDLPSKYKSDRPVATIHCSFILHDCCLGDPPFRDQIEVAIGTLYLKNRDGGVVPDHATHIYIEYALLGHCGPDLETDSVPRGEVMKFNHSKKLKVNDENAPHLKAMIEDNNPRPLRFTVLAEPCSLTSDTEVETVGHADINLNEEMIRKDQDLVSSQVPVYGNDGELLGSLSVTVLGIGTLQEIYKDNQVRAR